jgi:hypothetical protein
MMAPHTERRAQAREGRVYSLHAKPVSTTRARFYSASRRHELTVEQQEQVKRLCRAQMAIGEMRTRHIYYDWWGTSGPRFRLRAPWRIVRVRLMNALVKASFYMPRNRA